MPDNFLVVLTTLPSRNLAKKLAHRILKEKLAACVNVLGNVESFFWWEGKIDDARECLLLIKTRASRFERLATLIKKHHPYSVPEIIALPIRKGNTPYLKWLQDSVR